MQIAGIESTSSKTFCCVSLPSFCFCAAVFLIVYVGTLLAIGALHIEQYHSSALCAAVGLSCVATFFRNRTFHCMITGPLFLLVAPAVALQTVGVWKVSAGLLWSVVLIVVGAALLLERKLAS
ncbi:MAG TPA: hypothetical protein VJ731_06175 [Terriglobales bacterium]|nr:hypothetical protein [Terriglobales bacterium]